MKLRIAPLLIPMLSVLACDRPSHDAHLDEAREEPSAQATHEAVPSPAGILAIDPEMLRDLRITTAPAEARAGGEGITVLL